MEKAFGKDSGKHLKYSMEKTPSTSNKKQFGW
jgi:hypothetical protein